MDGDELKAEIDGGPCALPEDKMKELEREAIIRAREERLRSILSPIEGLVMNIQSLLVWENAQPSAVLFVCVNIVFWLAVTTNQRVVFISTMICFIVMCIETFRFRVWPNMQVNPKSSDEEDWTPLHLRLLSVPELCDHVARAWQVADEWYNAFWDLRRHEPAKFCTFTVPVLWTPLHLHLLSVPDLCDHVARAWQVADEWYNAFWDLRRHEPAKIHLTYLVVAKP
eukprot:XP_011660898.1 PREDICTED: protein FAM134C [Strongylocentrotus purpuratus]